jgi:hypothetical protein
VVVQLVSTAESILNRRLNELEPAEREALDIAYDCKEYVVDYLTRAFPTRQMEEYVDELGDVRSRPMWDEAGNPVHNPQAEAARAGLIEHICAMPPIPTALDALLEHYGVTRWPRSPGAANAWCAMARASSASKAARPGPTLPRPPRS